MRTHKAQLPAKLLITLKNPIDAIGFQRNDNEKDESNNESLPVGLRPAMWHEYREQQKCSEQSKQQANNEAIVRFGD